MQCDLAVQLASIKELREEQKSKAKEIEQLTDSNEFQKKKSTLYQKMVKELNEKNGFVLPSERWKLMSWIDNQSFENLNQDMYTEAEQDAAEDLYTKQQTFGNDPYLVYEVNKMHRVCNRKYQFQQKINSSIAINSH